MKPQLVNFYHDLYRPKFDPLAARTILLSAGGLLGILLLISFITHWQLGTSKAILTELQNNKNAAVEQVTQLGNLYPIREAAQELLRATEALEKEKLRKNRMLAVLNDGKIGTTAGFAPILRELASARTEGVWLTGIGVFKGGEQLLLEGEAKNTEPDRIPAIMQAITQRQIFSKRTFNRFNITKNEEKPDILQFHLATGEMELDRFWETEKEPGVLRKVKKNVEEARAEMKKAADITKMPHFKLESIQKEGL